MIDERQKVYFCELPEEMTFNNESSASICVAFDFGPPSGDGTLSAPAEEPADCEQVVDD